jgi:hypothetical protein
MYCQPNQHHLHATHAHACAACRLEAQAPLLAKPKLQKKLKNLRVAQMQALQDFVATRMPAMLATIKQRAVASAACAQLEVCLHAPARAPPHLARHDI